MRAWLILAAAIVSEVTATLCLKAALDHRALYVAVVAGYLASFGCLALTLRRGMPLGVAYGVWAALGVAVTAVMSAALFDEALTATMGAGIALIIGGVLAVELGARHPGDDGRPAGEPG